jgi:hypothetical protein
MPPVSCCMTTVCRCGSKNAVWSGALAGLAGVVVGLSGWVLYRGCAALRMCAAPSSVRSMQCVACELTLTIVVCVLLMSVR